MKHEKGVSVYHIYTEILNSRVQRTVLILCRWCLFIDGSWVPVTGFCTWEMKTITYRISEHIIKRKRHIKSRFARAKYGRVKRGEKKVTHSLVFSSCSITIQLLVLLLFPFLFSTLTNQCFRTVFLPLVIHEWGLNEEKGERDIRITKRCKRKKGKAKQCLC